MMEILVGMITLALIFEAITVLIRFGLKLSSKDIPLRNRIRIHHGYVGIVVMIVGILIQAPLLAILGGAMLISDLLHHFIVLYFVTGSTELEPRGVIGLGISTVIFLFLFPLI